MKDAETLFIVIGKMSNSKNVESTFLVGELLYKS